MYEYKCLTSVSLAEIKECFNLAFSDYYLPIHMTEADIKHRFESICVDRDLSCGAFYNGKLIGFIFNSCGIYNNEKVAYNAGTGVVPEHRGKKKFSTLYEYCETILKKHGIKKYYLEALQQNETAISAYKSKGFCIVSEYISLKKSNTLSDIKNNKLKYMGLDDFCGCDVNHCQCVVPCYEYCIHILMKTPNSYHCVYTEKGNKISSFCIFSKDSGNPVQLGFDDKNDLRLVLQELMSNYEELMVKNIDTKSTEILNLLYSLEFYEFAKQFEMVKEI